MDRAVDTTTPPQRTVRRVDDGIGSLTGDVADHNLDFRHKA